MFRACVLVACAVALAFMFASLRHSGEPAPLPPHEARPPGTPPSAKWLPESPRYQYARREALRALKDTHLDLGTERVSREQRFRVTIVERPEPVTLQEFQGWTLRIADRAGKPVSGAVLNIGGGMPRHGHGLPTLPRATATATAGEYRIEGLQFSMPGWWEIHVYVSKDRVEDIATFNLVLE